ncbi:ribonuclease TUDOR 1-like protein, partial [Tanacetum coccineum]
VVEVVSEDCIIVANDALPFGSPVAERRVNLSSIRCPKLENPQREEKPSPYAREAREFLRTRLIGRSSFNGVLSKGTTAPSRSADSREMEFGSVFLLSKGKGSEDVNSTTATPPATATQQPSLNVAELF